MFGQGGELVDADAQPFAIGERKGNIKVGDLTDLLLRQVTGTASNARDITAADACHPSK